MSKSAMKVVVTLVAAAVGFGAMQFFIRSNHEHQSISDVTDQINQAKADALKKNPNMSPVDAEHEAGNKVAAAAINSATPGDKRVTAASTFYGFYLLNVRARAEFCQQQGVDIHAFTDVFAHSNAQYQAVAQPLLTANNMSEDKLYDMFKQQLTTAVDNDMKDVASANKTNAKGACKVFVTHAAEINDQLQFAKNLPAAYQALMTAG